MAGTQTTWTQQGNLEAGPEPAALSGFSPTEAVSVICLWFYEINWSWALAQWTSPINHKHSSVPVTENPLDRTSLGVCAEPSGLVPVRQEVRRHTNLDRRFRTNLGVRRFFYRLNEPSKFLTARRLHGSSSDSKLLLFRTLAHCMLTSLG